MHVEHDGYNCPLPISLKESAYSLDLINDCKIARILGCILAIVTEKTSLDGR
jgi:hypothetical protein